MSTNIGAFPAHINVSDYYLHIADCFQSFIRVSLIIPDHQQNVCEIVENSLCTYRNLFFEHMLFSLLTHIG